MPFDLAALALQTREAASEAVRNEPELAARVEAAVERLRTLAWDDVVERVVTRTERPWLAGVPIGPMAERHAPPPAPTTYTVVSTDGSHLDQDHHDALPCWLINIGRATIRYGEDRGATLDTQTRLGFGADLYLLQGEDRARVQGQVLNVRRQVDELRALAELCEDNPGATALIDGSLVLTSINRAVQPEPTDFLDDYLAQLERIRASGALLASYISRPASTEAVSALRIGCCPLAACDRDCRIGATGERACTRLADVPDRTLFEENNLFAHERSGLWRSTWRTSERHYGAHAVHFFYFNAGPEIARIEVPEWMAASEAALAKLHAVLAAQSTLGDDGYPRVLIEAHHKAVITAGDRRSFAFLLDGSLLEKGYASLASAKKRAKRGRGV